AGDAGAPDANDEQLAASDGGGVDGREAVAQEEPTDGGASDDGGAAVVAVAEGDAGAPAEDDPHAATAASTTTAPPTTPPAEVIDEEHAEQAGAPANAATPGPAANLLSYFPKGHVVTLLLRFDRLRGTEWAAAGEKLLSPMPDYRTLIGDRPIHIADVFDTLVISTFSPRDVSATTLVGRTAMSPADLRTMLDHDGAPVAWSAAQGGALGRRRAGSMVFARDHRGFLPP